MSIAASTLFAFCSLPCASATVVDCCTNCFNASFCAFVKWLKPSIAVFACCLAFSRFWVPLSAAFVVFTWFIAASTWSLGTFVPVDLFKIFSALRTASLYAFFFSGSASAKFWLPSVVSLSFKLFFKLPIAVFSSWAVWMACVTSATVCAWLMFPVTAPFCALFKLSNVDNVWFALFLASVTFLSPFNACLVVVTVESAASTCDWFAFVPFAWLIIFSAAVTALLYAVCFSVSASVKLTLCFTWSLSWIPLIKRSIAWSNCSALVFTWFTVLIFGAFVTCVFKSCFWALFKWLNWLMLAVVSCFLFAKFCTPLSAVLLVFTWLAACVTADGSSVGWLVALMIFSALVTAVLYAFCLSVSASTYGWLALTSSLFAILFRSWFIALSRFVALSFTLWTPVTCVALSIWPVILCFCASDKCVIWRNVSLACCFAVAKFVSPFKPVSALLTRCVTAVTSAAFVITLGEPFTMFFAALYASV